MNRNRLAGLGVAAWVAMALLCPGDATRAAEEPCPILPTPKQYKFKGPAVTLSPKAVLLVGAKATAPERLAAEVLHRRLEQLFGMKLSVKAEGEAGDVDQKIVLGLRTTN